MLEGESFDFYTPELGIGSLKQAIGIVITKDFEAVVDSE